MASKDVDKRHGDPDHGGLSSGEKAAITREVHGGGEFKFLEKHPEKAAAAEEYRKEVLGKGKAEGKQGHAHAQVEHHHVGELSHGEKSAVSRQVHAGKPVEDLPFVQGHPKKLERAQEYAEQRW
ncbi:fatty acid desaturase [Micractinium conductrix]|uniref:Fatty acid desaturase n=1 Tax=Micractinium conductrix TaxID=554055 RepID=A0A2P6VIF5_9CHLO|nr:fatty acid desaturase [Micractinium conductrix]|eukprot:PSC73875.1 fatty acid desaturase [Micractinium conductrix]